MISVETLIAVLSFGIACFQVGYSLGSRKTKK